MFDLDPDGRLPMFAFLCFVLTALAQLPDLTGTPHDLVLDPLAGAVPNNGVVSFFRTGISGVAVAGFFLSVQQIRRFRYVGYIGCCRFHRVD